MPSLSRRRASRRVHVKSSCARARRDAGRVPACHRAVAERAGRDDATTRRVGPGVDDAACARGRSRARSGAGARSRGPAGHTRDVDLVVRRCRAEPRVDRAAGRRAIARREAAGGDEDAVEERERERVSAAPVRTLSAGAPSTVQRFSRPVAPANDDAGFVAARAERVAARPDRASRRRRAATADTSPGATSRARTASVVGERIGRAGAAERGAVAAVERRARRASCRSRRRRADHRRCATSRCRREATPRSGRAPRTLATVTRPRARATRGS